MNVHAINFWDTNIAMVQGSNIEEEITEEITDFHNANDHTSRSKQVFLNCSHSNFQSNDIIINIKPCQAIFGFTENIICALIHYRLIC